MSRRKINENENPKEKQQRKELEAISAISLRPEQLSWNRQLERMNLLYDDIEPIENEIIELQNRKIPLMDKINNLRTEMVKKCIHPYHLLVHNGDTITCKFCEKNISIPKQRRSGNGTKDL